MSMSPFICDGDAVIIKPYSSQRDIETGDIAAYINPQAGRLIIHRIIKKFNGRYLLKGDNICLCDGYCDKKDIHGYVKQITISPKSTHGLEKPIRTLFLFLNKFKNIIAFLSRCKLLTFVCRIANKSIHSFFVIQEKL